MIHLGMFPAISPRWIDGVLTARALIENQENMKILDTASDYFLRRSGRDLISQINNPLRHMSFIMHGNTYHEEIPLVFLYKTIIEMARSRAPYTGNLSVEMFHHYGVHLSSSKVNNVYFLYLFFTSSYQ